MKREVNWIIPKRVKGHDRPLNQSRRQILNYRHEYGAENITLDMVIRDSLDDPLTLRRAWDELKQEGRI